MRYFHAAAHDSKRANRPQELAANDDEGATTSTHLADEMTTVTPSLRAARNPKKWSTVKGKRKGAPGKNDKRFIKNFEQSYGYVQPGGGGAKGPKKQRRWALARCALSPTP